MVLMHDEQDDDGDLELKPLVVGCDAPDPLVSPRPLPSFRPWRRTLMILCGLAVAAALFLRRLMSTTSTSSQSPHKRKVPLRPSLTHRSIPVLQRRLARAEQDWEQQMRKQYGAYYDEIFYETTTTNTTERVPRGRSLFTSGNSVSSFSRARWIRKLALKVLEASSSKDEGRNATFVWATGGHSATAGHGNFYNESYTAYLEEALRPIFAAIFNLQFVGRNYAMGGTAAAPEIAWCAPEIFGRDLDVLVWDFGMTDGSRGLWKQALYHIRGGRGLAPVQVAFHAGSSRVEGGRYDIVQSMEEAGLAVLISSEAVMDAALAAVPDSFGLSDAGIAELPEFVQNFRCDTQIENGDPYCKYKKYHLEQCPERKFQTNWHPGWKWHALMG